MKFTSIASLLLIGAATSIRAQDQIVEISPQPVTIALTAKSFVEGTFEVDPETGKLTKTPAFESVVETLDSNDNVVRSVTTNAAKAVTSRLGNAQILAEVVDSLPDETISGWSIVLGTDEEGNPNVRAVKKGQEDVDLSELISFETQTSGPYNIVETYTARYTAGSDEVPSELIEGSEKTVISARGTDEGLISIQFADADLAGSFVQPWTGMTYYPDSTDTSLVEVAIIPGAGRVTGVIGMAETENELGTIYGGTINVAAAKGKVVSLDVE
jgi:hypothetical protein